MSADAEKVADGDGGPDRGGPPRGKDGDGKPSEDKKPGEAKPDRAGALKGAVVRALIAVIAMVAAAIFLIDWNAVVWETNRRETNDAQLRGNLTQLAARVGGYVAEVAVTDYQTVRKGDLLYRLEQDDYEARVAAAEANVAAAQAAVDVAEAEVASQRARVGGADASSRATAANLERARLERARQGALLGTESGLPRAYEAAAAQEQRLRAQLSGDQDEIGAQQAQVRAQQAQVDAARATLDQRRAELQQARVNLGYTRITAPADGVVGRRLAFAGQYVAPGTQLISLVPLDQVWAVAYYREEQVNRMRVGQPAEVRVDAYPGVVLHGHVQSLEPTSQAFGGATPPNRAVGSFTFIVQRIPVKIGLDPGHPLEGRLLPGLSVETTVGTAGALPPTKANP